MSSLYPISPYSNSAMPKQQHQVPCILAVFPFPPSVCCWKAYLKMIITSWLFQLLPVFLQNAQEGGLNVVKNIYLCPLWYEMENCMKER